LLVADAVDLSRRILTRYPAARVVVMGGHDETERNREIVRSVPGAILAPTDFSFGEFAALLAHCDPVITSDSLALHIATAAGCRVIAFFAPTSPWEVELYGGTRVLPTHGCIACYKNECDIPPKYDLDEMARAV
jgi:heptosyltransferase-2